MGGAETQTYEAPDWDYTVGTDNIVTIGNGSSIAGNAIKNITLVDISIPIIIPHELPNIDGKLCPVGVIGQFAFSQTNIVEIVIPNGVTTIEKNAFDYCIELTNLSISNSVTRIEQGAFTHTALRSIKIPIRFFLLTITSNNYGNDTFSNAASISMQSVIDADNWLVNQLQSLINSPMGDFHPFQEQYMNYFGDMTVINDIYKKILPNKTTRYELASAYFPSNPKTSAKAWARSIITQVIFDTSTRQATAKVLSYPPMYIESKDYCVFTSDTSGDGILTGTDIAAQLGVYKLGVTRYGSQQLSIYDNQPFPISLSVSFDPSVVDLNVSDMLDQATFDGTYVSSILISESIHNLDFPVFSNCKYLTNIEVDPKNTKYSSKNGVLFDKQQTTLIQYPIGRLDTSYIIPATVTSIANNAFQNCSNLSYIHFPNNLKIIGASAFSGCSNFKGYFVSQISINLINVTTIGSYAFSECSKLTYVNMSDNVTSIGSGAFSNCTSLTVVNLPKNISSISDYTFQGCTAITYFFIPDSTTKIGDYAFQNCSSLNEIRIGDWVDSIGTYSFNGCKSLSSLTLPPSVSSIGASAFTGCDTLIADPFNIFLSSEFYNKENGLYLDFPSAFYGIPEYNEDILLKIASCRQYYTFSPSVGTTITALDVYNTINSLKLTSRYTAERYTAYLSNNIETIDIEAFRLCTNMTSIYMSYAVKEFRDRAFEGCYNLNTCTINNLPYSRLENIGDSVFAGTGLAVFVIPDSTIHIGNWAFYDTLISKCVFNPGTKIATIGDCCFAGCVNLNTIIIPNNIKSVGKYAFSNCISLSHIIFPPTLETIGEYALENCVKITDLLIPLSVSNIGINAFKGLSSNFTFIYISSYWDSNINEILSSQEISATVVHEYQIVNSEMEYYKWCLNIANNINSSSAGAWRLLNTTPMWGYVTSTGQYYNIFYSATKSLDNVRFGNKLYLETAGQSAKTWASTTIANSAQTLATVKLVDTPELLAIRNTPVTYFPVANEKLIYTYFFNITTDDTLSKANVVTVLNGNTNFFSGNTTPLKIIGERAFENSNIISFEFPTTLTTISDYAFHGSRLSGILVIPNSVTIIGEGAFKNCIGITTIILPNSNLIIGNFAFEGCGISYIIIPSLTESIGYGAFQNCPNLANTYIPVPAAPIVPETSINTKVYENRNILRFFGTIITEFEGNSNNIPPDQLNLNSQLPLTGEKYIEYSLTSSGPTLKWYTQLVPSASQHVYTLYYNDTNGQKQYLVANITSSNCDVTDDINKATMLTIKTNGYNYDYFSIPETITIYTTHTFYNNYDETSSYFNDGITPTKTKYNYALIFDGVASITKEHVNNLVGEFSGKFVVNIGGRNISPPITIDDSAFMGKNVINVIIGNSVTSIGMDAFKSCEYLTSVSIGSSVRSIGTGAFVDCQQLSTVKVSTNIQALCNTKYFHSDKTITYSYYCVLSCSDDSGILTAYDVYTQLGNTPNIIASITFNKSVTSIADDAFNGNTSIGHIVIPPTVLSIGNYAFANCPNMESLICYGGDQANLNSIGEYVCYNCSKLSTVNLPSSLLSIGKMAFIECTNLYSVIIPRIFEYSYMTNTTNYFPTTNQLNVGWDKNNPLVASGTFFTFHFIMPPGKFCSYSYEEFTYITQNISNYNAELAAKAAKKKFWSKVGWDVLIFVVAAGLTILTDGIADTALGGITSSLGYEAEEAGGKTIVSLILTSAIATGLDEAIGATGLVNEEEDGEDPFTDSSSVTAEHTDGSWVATFTFSTTQRIYTTELYNYLRSNIDAEIYNLFNSKYINDNHTITVTQTDINTYQVKIILDVDFKNVTDSDKTNLENTVTQSIVSFVNPEATINISISNTNDVIAKNILVSDTCFPADTPINTDQGIIAIKNIDPKLHTINQKRIVAITQTITSAKHLIRFKKGSIGINYPQEDTTMTNKHKVYYKGEMIEAIKFVGKFKNVYKVRYSGEILYNVLMQDYDRVMVNNLVCETLHPENIVAKLYSGNFNDNDKNNIILRLNDCIYKNNLHGYNALVDAVSKKNNRTKNGGRLIKMAFTPSHA